MDFTTGFQGLFFGNSMDHVMFCLMGILLSVYALYVETRKSRDPKYVAACDFNESMSCSKVLTSEYSRGFGVLKYLVGESSMLNTPNCLLGIVAYSLQLIIGLLPYTWTYSALFYMSLASCLMSVYLAYILAFVLKDVCLVCIATYVTNAGLFYLSYQRFQYVSP